MAVPYAVLAGIGAASEVASGIASYYGTKIQASGYETQAIGADTQAYIANLNAQQAALVGKAQAGLVRLQGKADSLALSRAFNQTQASNAVMAAAQGRRFQGSVEAISEASERQYNWDLDFTEMSAEIQALSAEASAKAEEFGYKMQASSAASQAEQARFAARASTAGGAFSAIASTGLSAATSLFKIG